MKGVIYLVTNQTNGKVYIGQTTKTLDWRRTKHYSKSLRSKNNHFHNAIKKHKIENWTWDILEEIEIDDVKKLKSILDKYEKFYIKTYNSKNRTSGYNDTDGGDGMSNPSKETRIKIGSANRGKKLSEETKEKMSESRKGKVCSEIAKKLIGDANRGKPNWWKGKPKSDEQKLKMSLAARGRILSEEQKEKIRISCKNNPTRYWLGKSRSEETKEKIKNNYKRKSEFSEVNDAPQ